MFDLSGFQRDLLYVIAGMDDPHGLAVKAALEEYYGQRVPHSRLYPNLDALVEKGLLNKGTLNERTNTYSITPRGEREIGARRRWEAEIGSTSVN